MSTSCVRWIFLVSLAGVMIFAMISPGLAQEPFSEGFEDGNANGWTIWVGSGGVTTSHAHSGLYSMYLLHPNDDLPAVLLRNGFMANEGVFEAWFWVDYCTECSGMMAIQATDSGSNYSAVGMPYDFGGSTTIELNRTVDDVESALVYQHEAGLLPAQKWFKIRVHRGSDGLISIYTQVDGVERLWGSVNDLGITEAQQFVVGGWGGVYIDDIKYGPYCCEGFVGDANGDGQDQPSLGDIALMIDAKFISMNCELLNCMSEADVNHSGGAEPTCDDISIGDISYLIDYLFIAGPSIGLSECR